MTDHRHQTAARPHTTDCPYHEALYLHALIRSADHLLELATDDSRVSIRPFEEVGLTGLLTVIEERAAALAETLQFMDPDGWAVASLAVSRRK